MAAIITDQDFADVKRDIDDIGKSVNTDAVIDPRYGEDYKSLPMVSREFDATNTQAQSTINEWQDAISLITAEGGVPALAVSDNSGVTQQEINDLGGVRYWTEKPSGYQLNNEVRLSNGDIVKSTVPNNTTNPNIDMTGWYPVGIGAVFNGKNVREIAGALRNDGTGWSAIIDDKHNPINFASVEVVNNIDLKINFDQDGVKVIAGIITPDESYARLGLTTAASVGTGSMITRGYLPLEFSVTTNGANAPIVNAAAEIKNRITASRSGTKIRINHTGIVNDFPQVTAVSGSPNAKPIDITTTAMNILQETGSSPYTFRVWVEGGAWQLTTNMVGATLDTSQFATNGNVTINLGFPLVGNNFMEQSATNKFKDSLCFLYSQGLSTLTVRFTDTATNQYRTAIPANGIIDSTINYGAQQSGVNSLTSLPAGTYNVKRGLIPVYWDEIKSPDSYGGNANLWFRALISY